MTITSALSIIASALSMLLRCWLANRLLDIGLIDAARWVAPASRRT